MDPQSSSITSMKFFLAVVSALLASSSGFTVRPSLRTLSTGTTRTELGIKNSERAHIEKELEDMMDNDWRVFRAKLVAQEEVERKEAAARQKKENKSAEDPELAKQGQLGDLFVSAISSIFSPGGDNNKKQKASNNSNGTDYSLESMGTIVSTVDQALINACPDPFLSEAELPILLQPKVKIDKHRWAHVISHIEPGCCLVANENLGGSFHQTVVLVIDHSEKQGSTGIVINRPMKGNLMDIATAAGLDSKLDLSLKLAFKSAPVTYGGPVNADEYSILHGFGEVEGSRKLACGVFVGGSEELMHEVRLGQLDPRQALFVKGHAAWVAGQLSREIAKGVWYPAAISADMILRYAGAKTTKDDNMDCLWTDVMTCMGGKFKEKAKGRPSRGDRRMMP